ncbi:hypothetical protein [Alloyangia pacifica]|uniref:hypothetical protein n=1 Tax=Alloyangia pacifica TaxID=311180 RepID=UPI001CD3677F|nr:hypothetical protein [Alloyangia pacifica]MCA0998666.1 hypothetical protein [Alloyangia pacifica]
MTKLFLHVGHGKTGTSYLQSSFLKGQKSLSDIGIEYPAPKQKVSEALRGEAASGNGNSLFVPLSEIGKADSGISSLYSSEFLFSKMIEPKFTQKIRRLAERDNFDSVEVLLFIRNPIEHAASGWMQAIKRGESLRSIDEHFRRYKIPKQVESLLELSSDEGFNVTVKNYSAVRRSILEESLEWLGAPKDLLTGGGYGQVNRSLTYSEVEIIRALKSRIGKKASYLSDALCNRFPDEKSEPVIPSLETQCALLENNQDSLSKINLQISKDHYYNLEVLTPTDSSFEISKEKLMFTMETLGEMISNR